MEHQGIFFSYSRNDSSEFALRLAEELRTANADIWIDQMDLHGGSKWDLEIEKALKASTCVLFIVSEESVKSDNVLDEVYYALNKKKQVIPLITCNCEVPYRIERLERIDFIKDFKQGLKRLLKALDIKDQPDNHKTENTGGENPSEQDKSQQDVTKQNNVENQYRKKDIDHNKSISEKKSSLTGYDYDIYISYSHIDNLSMSNQEHGWIEQFLKDLTILLAQRTGRIDAVKILWDNEKLDGSRDFDKMIEGIKGSAILITLVSLSFLKSDYCQKELDIFYQKAQREQLGLKLGDRSRLLTVLLYNIPYEKWPHELGGTNGFHFNNAKSEDDRGMPLDLGSQQYRVKLRELSDSIMSLIDAFPKQEGH